MTALAVTRTRCVRCVETLTKERQAAGEKYCAACAVKMERWEERGTPPKRVINRMILLQSKTWK